MNIIKDYVKRQAENGVNPELVRYNLLRVGWDPAVVDKEILDVYSKQASVSIKKDRHVLRWVAFTVILVLVVLLLISLYILNKHTSYEPLRVGGNDLSTTNISSSNSCILINDSIKKDACYRDLVQKGYTCSDLTDNIEKNFCYRALEYSVFY